VLFQLLFQELLAAETVMILLLVSRHQPVVMILLLVSRRQPVVKILLLVSFRRHQLVVGYNL
jgi:hypothetical protein